MVEDKKVIKKIKSPKPNQDVGGKWETSASK